MTIQRESVTNTSKLRLTGVTFPSRPERRETERARARVSWKIQPQRSHEGALLHREDCGLYKGSVGFISREDAAIALDEPDIEPCQICMPENGVPPA
ncbi:DUF6233 domain-containing protein [Streptomyces sp. NPDC005480]|uniref:DUF6233 domain-containing protein n=1 Tax=Streptomyces sp. NPDC005480 TaxID=3154880 RepID=UPI0033B26AA4